MRQRRAQQHDAKVRVDRHDRARSLDRTQDALPHVSYWRCNFERHGIRARNKIIRMHAMPG